MKRTLALTVTGALLLGVVAACTPAAGPTPALQATATTKPAAASTATTKEAAASTPAAKATPRPLEKIKIMVPSQSVSFLPAYMGKEVGVFQEEGLDPEIAVLQSNLGTPALLNGEVDYADLLQPSLDAALIGEPVRLLMAEKARTSWRIILAQGLTSAEQIKGKGVALNGVGSSNQYAAEQGLKKLGIDPGKDVSFMNIASGADSIAALKGGSVAAAVMAPPFGEMAMAAGLKQALNTADAIDVVTGGIATTLKKMQENPGQAKRLIRAYLKSMAYIRDHKADTVKFTMNRFSMDQNIAESVITDMISQFSYDGTISEKGLSVVLDMTRWGTGPNKNATLEQIKKGFDFTLLNEVQKELGLSR